MMENPTLDVQLMEELDALRRRLMELEEMEVMRVTEEQERFDSLQVLDEYARQLEESRDRLARLLHAATDVQEAKTVQEALQKVADAVGQAGWGSVSVTLFKDWEVVQSAYFGCSETDIEFLETHRRPAAERSRFYGADFEKFKISRSYFVPADNISDVISLDHVVPGRRTVQPGDTWDPMDLAYVPLYGSQGQVIGSINCDDPLDGRRPNAETFFLLELFADLAARKVETTQLVEQQRRTENALRQSEEKYRTIFDRSGDGYFIMDELFRDCNNKACELWRCTPEDIIGHSPAEFSPEFQPDGRSSAEAAHSYLDLAMQGIAQCFYWQHRRRDGVLLDCEVSLAPIDVSDGKLILAIVRDITERKRSEMERETILRTLQVANSARDREQMVQDIFSEIGKLVPVENYYLALYDEQNDLLSFPHFVDEKDPPPSPIPLGHGLTAWVIRNAKPLRIGAGDFERMVQSGETEPCGTPPLSWLGVPLISQSKTIGALVVQSYTREGLYGESHERVFAGVAAHIATTVQRRRAEEDRQTMASLVENSSDCIAMLAVDGHAIYVNDAGLRLIGADRTADTEHRTVFDLFDTTAQASAKLAVEATVLDGHWEGELELPRVDNGESIPVQVHTFLIRHPGFDEEAALGVVARDLREHRRAERAVRESEERYRRLVEVSPDAVVIHQEGTVVYANQGAAKLVGAECPEDLIGKSSLSFIRPKTRQQVAERVQKLLAGEVEAQCTEEQLVKLDGTVIDVEVTAMGTSYESRPAIQIICRNISDRKRAYRELLMLRKAVEASADAIFMTDVDGIITFVNDEFSRTYGHGRKDVVGKQTPRILKSGTMSPEAYQGFWAAIRSKQAVKGELINKTKDGRLLTIEGSANPILDEQENIVGFLAIQRDITERKNAEKALKESEENLRWLVENLDDPIAILDTEELFIYANSAMARLFGVSADVLIGSNLAEFLDPQSLEFVKSQTRLRHSGARSRYELMVHRKDRQQRCLQITATPQFDGHRHLRSVVIAAKDLSRHSGA